MNADHMYWRSHWFEFIFTSKPRRQEFENKTCNQMGNKTKQEQEQKDKCEISQNPAMRVVNDQLTTKPDAVRTKAEEEELKVQSRTKQGGAMSE
jgi:hypothetical protein